MKTILLILFPFLVFGIGQDTLIPHYKGAELPVMLLPGMVGGSVNDTTYLVTKDRLLFYDDVHKHIQLDEEGTICEKIIESYKLSLRQNESSIDSLISLQDRQRQIYKTTLDHTHRTLNEQNKVLVSNNHMLEYQTGQMDELTGKLKKAKRGQFWKKIGIGFVSTLIGFSAGALIF